MPDLMDYLEWRGDLRFQEAPLCEVDNLIFCLLSYIDLDGIVPAPGKGSISFRAAAAEYFFSHPESNNRPLGLIIPADILTLFRRMAHTNRFRELLLSGYTNEICKEREMQFSALTIHLPNEELFVAFRGTDDTIVGWKEDFNLSVMDEVPAQRKAADYLNQLDMTPEAHLYVGGHSKGGNLAVWGAVHAEERVRARVKAAYSNDGPGFSEGTVSSEAYQALRDRIHLFLPEDSLIGLLLEHDAGYTVVKSSSKGLFQHNGLSWSVLGGSFLRSEGLSPVGIRNDTVIRRRIAAMSLSERRELIHMMFTILEATGAKTLTDLHKGGAKTALTLIKTYRDMPPEEQETAALLWDKLFGNSGEEKQTSNTESQVKTSAVKKFRSKGRIRISFFPLLLP
ncbi:MAG: DUF2974 domain-containing protein [Oscillospiraceae bacterium]|nr:DUF2974 domain-containing protein [Clostridia bacterium]MBP3699591.1 DUF2974 domain-containing protein [Oscillospiraceae bacterium]